MSDAAPPKPPQPPIEPGTVLADKYRVERIIGQGGMGVVVEARHITLDERVALKFLLPDFARHAEGAGRFIREARAAFKIKSEHVARVSDVGTLESGAPYMVMEFLVGSDLAGVLQRQGPLPIEDAVDYVIQACEAIAEAHGHGIIHRDLKPANLFLTRRQDGSPLVKVLDFGISKVSGAGVDNLTRTTTSMGSALYMSPEQMQQTRSVDHRTDIYALGVALFELLSCRPPFYAETLPQLCALVLTGAPTPLLSVRPDLPYPFAAALERSYARDRDHRYPTIAEFVLALAPFAPLRSHPTIDRIARMGGLPPPMAGAMGQRASQPSYPGHGPAGGVSPVPQAPAFGDRVSPAPQAPAFGDRVSPAEQGAIDPLAMAAAQDAPAQQIVPGPYHAPMSTRAAATFASSTGFNISSPGRVLGMSPGKLLAVTLAAVVVGLAGGVALRERDAAESADGAKGPELSAESPPATVAPPAAAPRGPGIEPPAGAAPALEPSGGAAPLVEPSGGAAPALEPVGSASASAAVAPASSAVPPRAAPGGRSTTSGRPRPGGATPPRPTVDLNNPL